jgi:starch phosphorylase
MHGDVSRRMWAGLFPERPEVELPVGYVTNGVHCSWLSQPVVEMLNRHIGPGYERRPYDEAIREKMLAIDEEEVWQAHHRNKQSLITYVRKKLADDLGKRGYIESRILKLTRALNPEFLTIVFARRFASYKRATLILRDKDRLAKILSNSTKPVQLLFAGKAHPADGIGKGMIKEIVDFAKAYQLEDRVMFIENYDMNVARHLAWGADVWLNNPIRENEASGTSGMKAAMNGVLNLSVPDGWWPEAYNGRNGWIITGGDYHNQFEMRQAAEAAQIYDLIEQEITELFYDRNEAGVPVRWVQMMKESISSVCCQFNMNRVLTDYVDRLYVPAKLAVETLSRDNYESVRQALAQGRQVLDHWDKIAIGRFATSVDRQEVVTEGERVSVTCSVDLAGAPPELFQVELFCAMQDQDTFQVVPMHAAGAGSRPAVYGCDLDIAGRGLASLNARIRPSAPIVQDLYPELVKWAQ